MILIVKHIQIEGPGTMDEFLKNSILEVKTVELGQEALPQDLSRIDAVIVLGGPMNVYEEDKYPFLKQESAFLNNVMKAEIPFMGICLGAQMLARAAGSKVSKAARKEIGWCRVRLTDEGLRDPLFEGLGKELEVFQWHEDRFDVPEGSSLLAESDVCPQAFRMGRNAYGLQFHYEVTPDMIARWSREYGYDVDGKKAANDEFRKTGQRIISNFIKTIKHAKI